MITFAAPQCAWFLLLPAGIVVLYLLRRKYTPKQVPSTFLWTTAIRDHAANRPLQRLRKNLLLPVQFLAMLVLALALMQPNLSSGAASRTVMIFDLSGSMQTVSDGKTRLEEAKDRAEEMLSGLAPGEEITVLAAGTEVRQILTAGTDKEDVRRAIRGLVCGREGADLDRAVSLAEAIRREETDRGTRIVVFSDTYTPPAGVSAVNVGRGEENRGVYVLSAEEGSAYARLCNFGGDCRVTVLCLADGKLCEAKEVEIPAGETAGVSFTLPEGTLKAEVQIREEDAIPADNRAETAVLRSKVRTVALTGDNLFLESALQVRQDLRVVRTDEESLAQTEADLYIYGSSPLIFSRDPSQTVFTWPEEEQTPATVSGNQTSSAASLTVEQTPLTDGVTLRNVTLRSCRPLSGGKAAVRAGNDVILAYTDGEAAFGFRLQDSNLPLKYDFPVLIQNMLNQLLPETAEEVPETEPPMAAAESDVRAVAQSAEAEAGAVAAARGQDLTGLLMGVFLLLLMVEFVLAREPWARDRRLSAADEGRGNVQKNDSSDGVSRRLRLRTHKREEAAK